MPAKQTIVKTSHTKTTTTRTRSKVKTTSGKKGGNQKRCPACGRYM